jgi:hypothetical protein
MTIPMVKFTIAFDVIKKFVTGPTLNIIGTISMLQCQLPYP